MHIICISCSVALARSLNHHKLFLFLPLLLIITHLIHKCPNKLQNVSMHKIFIHIYPLTIRSVIVYTCKFRCEKLQTVFI